LIYGLSRGQGTAALVVTHDQALSGRADRVLRLEQGVLKPET
jgi:predicted ABC-type transport system involved in lysophospholipase L1 biosynthesis ATPase subunit